jgi:hypothetical protein
MAGTGRLRGFGMVALGGAIPVAVLVPYFAAYGAVSDLLEGFVILNAKYSSGRSLTSRAGGLYADLHEGFGVTLWLLLGGLLLLVVVTALRLADRRTRREPTTATLLALTVCLVFSLLWTEIDYDSWVDTFPFLPLAAIGIGAGLAELGRRVSPRVVAVVGALAVVLPTIVAFQFAISTRNNDLTEQRATTRNVISHLPNATIWSIEAPEYLVLADRANPTRYQLFSEGLQYHLDDTWPGGLDGFVRWNLDRKPELIALSLDEMKDGHWRSRIGSDYVEVARSPAIMWLANRSVGHEVIHSIRSADRRLHERFGDES